MHPLTQPGTQPADGAVERGIDGGLEKILLGALQGCLGVGDLVLRLFDAGEFDVVTRFHTDKDGFGDEIGFKQLLVATIFRLGLGQLSFGCGQSGQGGFVAGLGGVATRFVLLGLDAHQKVALAHRLAFHHG